MYYCFLGSKYQKSFLKVISANMIVFYSTPHGCYYTFFVISISYKLHYLFLFASIKTHGFYFFIWQAFFLGENLSVIYMFVILQFIRCNSRRFLPSQADEEAHQLSYLQKHMANILTLLAQILNIQSYFDLGTLI